MRTPRPGKGDQTPIPEGGYVSARDMPTFVEMEKNLAMLKAVGFAIPGIRDQIRDMENRLAEMVESIDGFYAVMGDRDWVYSDQLSLDELRGPIEANDVEELEAVVIASYNDPSRLDRLIAQLAVVPDMKDRMPMVRLARDDYFAGRFYSTTLVLIAVMDGFVNDIERARRGLTARDPDEIDAWDSVVGHHLGLKKAHRAFKQTFKATSAQEIFSLHRNGIVHGNLVNFNNLVVATKAWNRLLAVKDWASAIEKAKESPPPPPPPLSESFKQIVATVRRSQTLKEWKPRTTELERVGAEQLQREPAGVAAAKFFDAWRTANYGGMASHLRERRRAGSAKRFAGIVRERFEESRLTQFQVVSVQMMSASTALVTAELTLNGQTFINESRWVKEGPSGKSLPEFEDGGEWLVFAAWSDDFTERR